jgi:hypothetical protein
MTAPWDRRAETGVRSGAVCAGILIRLSNLCDKYRNKSNSQAKRSPRSSRVHMRIRQTGRRRQQQQQPPPIQQAARRDRSRGGERDVSMLGWRAAIERAPTPRPNAVSYQEYCSITSRVRRVSR